MVFRAIALPQEVLVRLPQLGMGGTLLGHDVTRRDDIILLFGILMNGAAVWAFRRQE